MEVHHMPPRYPGENPLLLVMRHEHGEEWYFEVNKLGSKLTARARCRLAFREEDGEAVKQLGNISIVPEDVQEALLDYEGPHEVELVGNPSQRHGVKASE